MSITLVIRLHIIMCLKHGYRYVSEMAWAFLEVKKSLDFAKPIKIISIGCGPSTELYGAIVIFRNAPFYYYGFDLSSVWKSIQYLNNENLKYLPHIIQYYNYDFIQYVFTLCFNGDLLPFQKSYLTVKNNVKY